MNIATQAFLLEELHKLLSDTNAILYSLSMAKDGNPGFYARRFPIEDGRRILLEASIADIEAVEAEEEPAELPYVSWTLEESQRRAQLISFSTIGLSIPERDELRALEEKHAAWKATQKPLKPESPNL